jgi:hypothetical protein
LDQFYENLNGSQRDGVKNSILEKIELNGIPAIKVTDEYYEGKGSDYGIFLTFMHNGIDYTFYFSGNNLEILESTYELVKSSIILK